MIHFAIACAVHGVTDPKNFREKYADNLGHFAEQNRLHLLRVLELMPENAAGLEIGCFTGGTSCLLLENGISTLDVIDPFTGSPEHVGVIDTTNLRQQFRQNTERFGDRVNVFEFRSDDGLLHLARIHRTYDFIYVDGSHDSRDVIIDAVLGFKLLKPGGVVVFDDALWAYYSDPYRNPKPAIDFFLQAYSRELRVLEKGYQVSIQKL